MTIEVSDLTRHARAGDFCKDVVKSLNCDTALGQPRPQWLTANDAVSFANDLMRQ